MAQPREGESDLAPVLRSVVGQVSHHLPQGNSVSPTAKARLIFDNLEEHGIRQALQDGSHLRLFSGPSLTQSFERWQLLLAEKLIWPPLPTRQPRRLSFEDMDERSPYAPVIELGVGDVGATVEPRHLGQDAIPGPVTIVIHATHVVGSQHRSRAHASAAY